MDANLRKIINIKVKTIIKQLEKNNMKGVYVESKEDALKLVKELVKEGSLTASGGSATLTECGIIEYLKSKTEYLERYDKSLTPSEKLERERRAFYADYYLSSANAITEHGEIYQVDGNANRVAALSFGPSNVIMVVGINKIVKDLRSAVERVKYVAAPSNATRYGLGNYCEKAGHCIQSSFDSNHLMCASDCGEKTICRNTLIMARQLIKDRVTVILVGEELGY